MIFVYCITALIFVLWILDSLQKGYVLFKRTPLDIPLLIYMIVNTLSTIFSIDPYTSLLGYYSRFNGGLLSIFCYSLLYWSAATYLSKKDIQKISLALIASTFIVSTYGVLQHFGIDEHIWVQEVKLRVFATFGQPNWLAAWIAAVAPIGFYLSYIKKQKKLTMVLITFVSILSYTALLYTKSRSGFLAYLGAYILFWGGSFLVSKKRKELVAYFMALTTVFFIISYSEGTPWSQSLAEKKGAITEIEAKREKVPLLETGSVESAEIRKVVWRGAFESAKAYPLLGTGPETFGISYYSYRPQEHNLTSEWDFLYNKAHNEFLNTAATTGFLGLGAYLFIILVSGYQLAYTFFKGKEKLFALALGAGYASLQVTNFFGFSVVPTSLIFFLFPTLCLHTNFKNKKISFTLKPLTKTIFQAISVFALFCALVWIGTYWYADVSYSSAKRLNNKGLYFAAEKEMATALSLNSHESIYWMEQAKSDTGIAIYYFESGDTKNAQLYSQKSDVEIQKALSLSPRNTALLLQAANRYINLTEIDQQYIENARNALEKAYSFAPTDAKISYNLALSYIKTGQISKALAQLEKTVILKTDYRDARFAHALMLIAENPQKAREELEYILNFIKPDDKEVIEELKKLESQI